MSSVAIALCLVLLLARPCEGAFRPRILSQASSTGVRVTISDRPVATVRTGTVELLPLDRAERFIANLYQFLDGGGAPWQIRPVRLGAHWAVSGPATPLIQVTPAEAAAHGMTARRLATLWARNLRTVLSLPPLTAPVRQVILPLGERRTVSLGGVAIGQVLAIPSNPDVVIATPQDWPRNVVLQGLTPGVSAVRVEVEGAALTLSVRVMKRAAVLASAPTIDLTGRPVPGSLVRSVAMARFAEGLVRESGTWVRLLRSPATPPSLAPGQATVLAFPVVVAGTGYLPVKTKVHVCVRNRRLPEGGDTAALLYSNDPERVTRPQTLYLASLTREAPSRLLYHHQNGSGGALQFRIELQNHGDELAEVHVIRGDAGPSVDTILVGHRAAVRYLKAEMQDLGEIVSVPPGRRRTILSQRLSPMWTASGLYSLRVLKGADVYVRILADEARGGREPVLLSASPIHDAAPLASRGSTGTSRRALALSRDVYPEPRKRVEASYTVGERWAFVNLGRAPISAREPERRLAGNYGVVYEISLRLENPMDEERIVRVILSPDAGDARGVFVIDGRLVEAPHVTPPAEVELAQFRLKAAERRTVSIRTIPVGGSSYPVSLVVRS
jgi:hypothetical protein